MTTVPSTFHPEGTVTVKAGSLFDDGSLMVAVVVVEGRAACVGCGAVDDEGEAVVAAAVAELLQATARDTTTAHTSTERARECMTPPREFIGCARVSGIISRQRGRVEEYFVACQS
jgi:hypothetical protein